MHLTYAELVSWFVINKRVCHPMNEGIARLRGQQFGFPSSDFDLLQGVVRESFMFEKIQECDSSIFL